MPLRRNLRIAAAAGALIVVQNVFAAQAGAAVTAVRFWSLTDVTRVVVETTDDFEFTSDRVNNPERLFFDLAGLKMRMGRKGQETIAVGDHLLKQIRVAEPQRGTTRVVFDLENEVEFSASQLSNPSRLIIELRPAGSKISSAPVSMSITREQKLPPEPVDQNALIAPEAPPLAAIEVAKATLPKNPPLPLPARPISVVAKPDAVDKPTKVIVDRLTVNSPAAARLPKNGDPTLARVLGLKIGRIVLDAGHGGHDGGTNGPGGLMEKDLVLDVTQRLGALIESRMGCEVIYTRNDDTFVPLHERTRIANEHKADLFLSIHANSSPVRAISGVETYYLNFTTQKSALEVAARENATSDSSVYDLKDLVQQITLKDKVDESKAFAAQVQASMFSATVRSAAKVKDRGVKKAPFVVLIGAQMPSVLCEIGFVSNPRDETMLKRSEYRQKLAEALYRGLSQYAGTLSHFQVAQN
jgi:N-acetylmuramoyl-L-alanine amidase